MAKPPPRWDAFVSYARADAAFVDAVLRELPRARGRRWRLWVDRSSMPGRGEPFPREISRAIAACDRVVVFVTRAALASEWVQAEWRQALANDQVVLPMLRLDPPPADAAAAHAGLPPELAALQVDDLSRLSAEACARRLHARLREPLPALGPLSLQVPQAPGFLEPRPALLAALRARLGAPSPAAAPRTVLLHGMSGAGKSVAAAAFARATATRRAFEHGVVWLQAVEWENAPDDANAAAQRTLARQLAAMPNSPTLESLRDTACRMLIVVDDVHAPRGLDALGMLLGPNVCTLLTSQHRDLAQALGAAALEVPPLSPDESLSLLARVARTTPGALPEAARRLAVELLGGLPYALAVAGAMAADDAWDDLLLRVEHCDLQSLARSFPGYPHPTVFAMLGAATARLDADARRLLRVLHVFGATQPVPEAVLVRYWQRLQPQPGHEARGLLSRLAQACLLTTSGASPHRWVRVHELQLRHGLATAQADESLRALAPHAVQACDAPPDEVDARGYRLRALVQHLDQADDADGLHRLLAPGERGADDWHADKSAAGDLAGYVDDIARAWAVQRRRPDDPATSPRGLAYALLASTGRAVHTRLSEPLKAEACQRGLVAVDALLSEAELHDEAAQRARHLLELLPLVAGERRLALQGSIEALLEACSAGERIALCTGLAAHGIETAAAQANRAWQEAARSLSDAPQAAAWGRIAALPCATPPQRAAARAALVRWPDQPAVQDALVALMPCLSATRRREAIDTLLSSPPPSAAWDRAEKRAWADRLARLLRWAGRARQRRLADTVIALNERWGGDVSLEPFVRWLSPGFARRRFEQALQREQGRTEMYGIRDMVESFRLLVLQDGHADDLPRLLDVLDRWPRFEGGFGVYATATARARLVPFAAPASRPALWEAALQASLQLPQLHQRQRAWAALRESAATEDQVVRLLHAALAGSQAVEDTHEMRSLVETLAPGLDREGLALAQRLLSADNSGFDRSDAAVALAKRAFELGDPAPARQMLDDAKAHVVLQTHCIPLALLLDDAALERLWPSFDPAEWLRAAGCAFALARLVARLPQRLDALLVEPDPRSHGVSRFRDLCWREFIAELARQGRPDLALTAARRLTSATLTVAQIAEETAADAGSCAVQAFLRHAGTLVGKHELDAVRLFLGPGPVGTDAFARALQSVAVREADDLGRRVWALVSGLRHADEAARERWFDAALAAAQTLPGSHDRALALNALSDVAPATAWRSVVGLVHQLHPSEQWAAVPLVPRLAQLGLADPALALARALPAPLRAGALARLAMGGTDWAAALLPDAIDEICALPLGRWPMLERVSPAALRLPRADSIALLDKALQRLSRRPRRELLADLRGLLGWLQGLHGPGVLVQLLAAVDAVRRRWP